jgi:Ca2+-binding EF-hand superfamily protein
MKAGTLVPTPVVLRVLQRHLEQSTGPVLLDGFPRVVDQMDKLSELGNVLGVLFLDCEEAVLRERMDKTDCNDEVALIAQFTDHCLPVLDLYDKEGLVQVVDASASAEVVEVILQKLIQSILDGHITSPQEAAPAADDVTAPAPESESAAPSAEDGDIATPQEPAPAVDDATASPASEPAPNTGSTGSTGAAPEPEAPVEAVSEVMVPSVEEWGENVFKQFDTDKDGRLSKKEMARALRSLPKKKPKSAPPGAKFMSVDELMAAMDSDDNGTIDLQEWVDNLASCAGLAAAIAENVNEAGEIPTFRSFEQQQAKCKAEVLELETKESRTEEDDTLLTDLKLQIENLQAKIEEAAANQLKLNEWGRSTFEQFDTDKNGQLSPQELATALKALPRRKPKNIPPGSKFMSIEEMMDAMDADGDGAIDVDEWLSRLGQCAGLAAALAENVGEDGKLSNFVASSATKTETVLEPEPEPEALPQLQSEPAAPSAEEAALETLLDEDEPGASSATKTETVVEPEPEPEAMLQPESEPAAPSAEEAALEALLDEDEEENTQVSAQVEDKDDEEEEEAADEGPTVRDKLQAELQAMTVKQLKQRARDLGVDEDTIHDIDDADDVKTAAIQMVTAATPAPEPEPDTAEGRGKLKHEISLHPPPGGGVLANLRAHSQRLDAVEGGLITEKLHKGKDGDDELLEKLRSTSSKPKGKLTEEEREAKAKEKAWLQEQKTRSLKLKEQALAKQDAWSADMQALRSRRRAKTAGKRWVTHSRVQRRVRYNEEQRKNAATLEEKVQIEWSKFQQQHSQK